MACPFGFGAGAGGSEDEEDMMGEMDEDEMAEAEIAAMLGHSLDLGIPRDDGDCEPAGIAEAMGAPRAKKQSAPRDGKDSKKGVSPKPNTGGGPDGEEMDPLKWFAKHGIKNEAEFEAKKDLLRAEAQKRLDALEESRKKLREIEGSEFGSIFSSDLSELDGDAGSLCSLKSCADAWAAAADYTAPAEATLKLMVILCGCQALWAGFKGVMAIRTMHKVVGVLLHTWWPSLVVAVSVAMITSTFMAYLSTMLRSKSVLLTTIILFIVVYASSVAMAFAIFFQPTSVDERLKTTACRIDGRSDAISRICSLIPGITDQIGEANHSLLLNSVGMCVWSIVMVGFCVRYALEMSYMEMKGMKYRRRERRTERSIPWDKIKILDWVTDAAVAAEVSASAPAPAPASASAPAPAPAPAPGEKATGISSDGGKAKAATPAAAAAAGAVAGGKVASEKIASEEGSNAKAVGVTQKSTRRRKKA